MNTPLTSSFSARVLVVLLCVGSGWPGWPGWPTKQHTVRKATQREVINRLLLIKKTGNINTNSRCIKHFKDYITTK